MKRAGFTLTELMVVIAIALVMVALLLPMVSVMREKGRMVACAANLQTLGTGAMLHASDNDGSMPASISWGNYEGYRTTMNGVKVGMRQRGFIGSEVIPDDLHPSDAAALTEGSLRHSAYETEGMLYRYVGLKDIRRVLRCPSLEEAPAPRIGGGVGSNGLHDYSMVSGFTGARTSGLPVSCKVDVPSVGTQAVPVPLFIEEDPAYGCNARYVEMDFTTINRMGTWHHGYTGQYFTTQGGVHTLTYGRSPGPRCLDWYDVPTPRGNLFRLGDITPINYNRLLGREVSYGNQTYEPIGVPKKLYGGWHKL